MNFWSSYEQHVEYEATRKTNRIVTDINFVEFRPSVVAASAFQCGLDNVLTLSSTVCLTNYIHQIVRQDQRVRITWDSKLWCTYLNEVIVQLMALLIQYQEIDLMKCQKLMEVWLASECFKAIACGSFSYCPSSPVTVLLAERINVNDDHVDLSIFMVQARSCIGITKSKKTKRLRKSISWTTSS